MSFHNVCSTMYISPVEHQRFSNARLAYEDNKRLLNETLKVSNYSECIKKNVYVY